MFVQKGILKESGLIWLPGICNVNSSLIENKLALDKYYTIQQTYNLAENPLYFVSDLPEIIAKLNICPDLITNETQCKNILYFHVLSLNK